MTERERPSRREWGSGSVIPRGKKFRAQISVNGQRLSKTFRSRRAALDWLARTRTEALDGELVAPTRLTVKQHLDEWYATFEPRFSENTRSIYQGRIRLLGPLHQVPLSRLSVRQIDQLVSDLLAAGYAPSSVKQIRQLLSSALRTAVRWKRLRHNLVLDSRPVPVEPSQRPVWSVVQARAFLALAARDDLAALWRLELSSGLRNGELRGLHWADVDGEAGLIRVRWTLAEKRTWEHATKTRRERVIPLTAGLAAALEVHRDRQAFARARAGAGWAESDHVFTLADGRPLEAQYLRKAFRALCRAAGAPAIRFHDLRHTVNTLLADRHPKVAQQLLGHTTAAMNQRYTNVDLAALTDAVEGLDRLLGSP